MSQTEVAEPVEAEPAAEEPAEPTRSIANKYGTSTSDRDGNEYEFAADAAQDVPESLAAELLSIKDAGFYEPGQPENVFAIDPSVTEAERRGRTMKSPFEPPPEVAAALAVDPLPVMVKIGLDLYNVADLEIPPKHGRGSSAAAWQDYADGLRVVVPDDVTTRDDLIAFLESQGVPTEQQFSTATRGSDLTDGDDEPGGGDLPGASEVTSEVDPATTQSEVAPEAPDAETPQ